MRICHRQCSRVSPLVLQYENTSVLHDAVTTSDGYVVVAGVTTEWTFTSDFWAMKLDPTDGELLWRYQASLLALISLAVKTCHNMSRLGK